MAIAQLNAAPVEGVEYVFPLPHSPRAVSTVRRRAEAILTRWNLPAGAAEDVLLVISELLTNAVVHAFPPAALRLSRGGAGRGGSVRCSGAHPVTGGADPRGGGRGRGSGARGA
ncbi:ATP-binding protein, partial [Streptomyces sp. NPDC059717]|uniref:ATP-binding protein n=1 Tax=Streptomyces sp. NPDC059717 TaxID=3346922 RepID=UPI0036B08524